VIYPAAKEQILRFLLTAPIALLLLAAMLAPPADAQMLPTQGEGFLHQSVATGYLERRVEALPAGPAFLCPIDWELPPGRNCLGINDVYNLSLNPWIQYIDTDLVEREIVDVNGTRDSTEGVVGVSSTTANTFVQGRLLAYPFETIHPEVAAPLTDFVVGSRSEPSTTPPRVDEAFTSIVGPSEFRLSIVPGPPGSNFQVVLDPYALKYEVCIECEFGFTLADWLGVDDYTPLPDFALSGPVEYWASEYNRVDLFADNLYSFRYSALGLPEGTLIPANVDYALTATASAMATISFLDINETDSTFDAHALLNDTGDVLFDTLHLDSVTNASKTETVQLLLEPNRWYWVRLQAQSDAYQTALADPTFSIDPSFEFIDQVTIDLAPTTTEIASVPEPGASSFVVSALALLAVRRWVRRTKTS
jgi:hypothetical protein